jgi:hypothetical protein
MDLHLAAYTCDADAATRAAAELSAREYSASAEAAATSIRSGQAAPSTFRSLPAR